MTGLNKNVLSIYSKLIGLSFDGSKLKIAISECNDTLSKSNIRELSNMGIPIIYKHIRTKQELSDFILKEVIDYIPILKDQEFRKIKKSLGRLNKVVEKQIHKIII